MINDSYCPICSSSIVEWKTKVADDQEYKIDLCNSCRYVFINPRPTLEFISNYYANFHISDEAQNANHEVERYSYSVIDAKRIVKNVSMLTNNLKGLNFLDVGCGHGLISREAINSGFNVTALELSDIERDIAFNLTKTIPINSSFEDYSCKAEAFDILNLSQILEHAVDINLWVSKANFCLKKGGLLAIALPNFNSFFRYVLKENDPYICPPVHLNFFSHKNLSKLLDIHGFDVEYFEFISRIPDEAILKRIPKLFHFILPLVKIIVSLIFKIFDLLQIGIMINIYAKKR
jgi:2-polyprenyl-3-methyl-5-hydroxy-6-metoxy-1,4-benzoquinol methylase